MCTVLEIRDVIHHLSSPSNRTRPDLSRPTGIFRGLLACGLTLHNGETPTGLRRFSVSVVIVAGSYARASRDRGRVRAFPVELSSGVR